MPPKATKTPNLDLLFQGVRNRAEEARLAEEAVRGGDEGFLDDITSGFSGVLSTGAQAGMYALSTAGRVLDLPRQYVSKPILGSLVATAEGRWDEIGSINDLRTMWNETDMPGAVKFGMELGTDPLIFFGGWGFFKGTGAKIATGLMRQKGLLVGAKSGFAATKAAFALEKNSAVRQLGQALAKGEPITDDIARPIAQIMNKQGLVTPGRTVDDIVGALTSTDAIEGGQNMLRAIRPGIIARNVGPLSRVLGPVEVAWEAMWNVPIAGLTPLVMKAGRPFVKAAGLSINAFGETRAFRKFTGWASNNSQFFRDLDAFADASRPLVGRGSFLSTPTAQSVERLGRDASVAAWKDVKRIAARTGMSDEQILLLVRNDDEFVKGVFNAGLPGGVEHESLTTLTNGLRTVEPNELAGLLKAAADGGEDALSLSLGSMVIKGMKQDLGVIEGVAKAPGALVGANAAIINSLRPTVLARGDFAVLETVDNFMRAGNIFSLTPADFDWLGRYGLPESLKAGKLGIRETFLDALIPFRRFREQKVGAKAARGITEKFTPEDAALLQKEIDELPPDVAKEVGAFIAAPGRNPEALDQLPYMPSILKRYVKGYQRRMQTVDGRAGTHIIWDAASEALVRDALTTPPQTINKAQGVISQTLRRFKEAGFNPNLEPAMRRDLLAILSGDKEALTRATKRLSIDNITLQDFITQPDFLGRGISPTAREAIANDVKGMLDDGVPAALAIKESLARNAPLAYRTVGENLQRQGNLLRGARDATDDIYASVGVDRVVSRKVVTEARKSSVKRIRSLEARFGLGKGERRPLTPQREVELGAENRRLKTLTQESDVQREGLQTELKRVQDSMWTDREAARKVERELGETLPMTPEHAALKDEERRLVDELRELPKAEDLQAQIDEVRTALADKAEHLKSSTSYVKLMKKETLAFEMASDDIDVTAISQLSAITRRRGRLSAQYMPYLDFDADLARLVDTRLNNAHAHVMEYAKLIGQDDPAALVSLKKIAKLFPEWRPLVESGALLPPSAITQMYRETTHKMWGRFIGAKVMMADEIAARAGSRSAKFGQRSYLRLLDRTVKEVVGAEDLAAVRSIAAQRNLETYGFSSDMLPALEQMESSYEATAGALMEKYRRFLPDEAAKEVDATLFRLGAVAKGYEANALHTQRSVDALHDFYREANLMAKSPGVAAEMELRMSHHLQKEGIAAWRRKFVDYRYQTGVDRMVGMFSMFPVWGLRLPGYLAKQFVERPGYIIAMNHLIQSKTFAGLGGVGVGGGFFLAPHLRMSMMPIMARKGETFIFEGDHPMNQMTKFVEAMGIYPGPHAQLALDGMGSFLNQTGITTGKTQVDPETTFGLLPPQFRWLRDFTRIMGINEGRGINLPFQGGSNSLFERAVQRELSARVSARIESEQAKLDRPLYDDEVVDIRDFVHEHGIVDVRRTVAARDLALAAVPGLRYTSPDEVSTMQAAREFMVMRGVKVEDERGPIINAYFDKLSRDQRRELQNEIPAFKEFISLPVAGQAAKERVITQAKRQYFSTVDSIWAPVRRQQRLLDEKFQAGEIDAPTWREARGGARRDAVMQVEGLKRDPEIQLWLARAEKGIADSPEEFAQREFAQLEPADIDGDGLILRDDMKAFFEAQRVFLARQPGWVKDHILSQRTASFTPLEAQYENARSGLDGYYDIPRYVGLTEEEGEIASKVITQARSIVRMQPGRQSLLEVVMMLPVDPTAKNLAIRALRSGPPAARAQYWAAHPELQVFFPDLSPAEPRL